MEIQLLTVGKTTLPYVVSGTEDFLQRLKRYINYRIVCVPDIRNTRGLTETQQKDKEGDLLLSNIQTSDLCILLDEHGREFTSIEFAKELQKYMSSGRKRVIFIVGGPYGFSEKIYARADGYISMSKMTFTHEMVRLFFTEQVYRAMTILRGEPYHHE